MRDIRDPYPGRFQGDLKKQPVYRVFSRIYEQRACGHLYLLRGKASRHISFRKGYIRFAASNLKHENIGEMQVATGEIDGPALAAAIEHARSNRCTMAEALVATSAMEERDVQAALAAQIRAVAIGAIAWSDGAARFEVDSNAASNTPPFMLHPFEVIFEGLARHYPPDAVRKTLERRLGAAVRRTEALEKEKNTLGWILPGGGVLRRVAEGLALADLIDGAPEEDLVQIFGLLGTGLLRLVDSDSAGAAAASPSARRPKENAASARVTPVPRQGATKPPPPRPIDSATPSGPPPQPRPAEPDGQPAVARQGPRVVPAPAAATIAAVATSEAPATRSARPPKPKAEKPAQPDLESVIRSIQDEHRRLSEATLYEVLGVATTADSAAVQAAYLGAAKKWHVDRFARYPLGDAGKQLNSIFSSISEAREVLSDPGQRREYDILLDRKAKGLPTDVAAIIKAETLFREGERLLETGKASVALERFEAAISLNAGEPEMYAWRGYARYKSQGASALAETKADISRALEADAEMASAHYFLGMMALDTGNAAEAARRFERAIEKDPRHTRARRQLHAMKKEGGKKGVLGKILKP